MSNLTEIRWHGRGGQGAKTAALLLADVAFQTGKYVQGFPEYGPERMGAPITAYNRISDKEIRVHSNIYDPQYVVVVDESLLEAVDVTKGLRKDGAILVNTQKTKEEIIPQLKGYEGKIYILDAHKVSMQTMGKWILNYEPKKKLPVEEFLRPQGRFKHLFKKGNEELMEEFQREVDRRWEELQFRCSR